MVKVDTSKFDRKLKEYMKFSKRSIAEIVNSKIYFVARNAVNTTVAVDKNKIDQELNQPSRTTPKLSLAEILAKTGKVELKNKKGKIRLNSPELVRKAAEKLIRIRKNTVNFLRAGWIWSIRNIEPGVKVKTGAPRYSKIKVKGQPKGGGKLAKESSLWKSSAMIFNSVQGGETPDPKVKEILTDGLNKAVQKELASMQSYILKKMAETAKIINRN